MTARDIDDLLIEQYRVTGKVNFLDLAHFFEMAMIYQEAFAGGGDISIPKEIAEMAWLAASIAGKSVSRPKGAPPKARLHHNREVWQAVALLISKDGIKHEAVIAALGEKGISRAKAIPLIKEAKAVVEGQREKP